MTNGNTYKVRIQLKSDTEANWLAHPITPLNGEVIIFSADVQHPYSRLKVGDGVSSVNALPFIDAGTINGETLPEEAVQVYNTRSAFPNAGIANVLYVALDTNQIYCYAPTSGFTLLSNFNYTIKKDTVSKITYWRSGDITKISNNQGTLQVRSGIASSLLYEPISVVTDVIKEDDT